jgi:hypothetical protein
MRTNHNLFDNILPQTPLSCGTPTVSLAGLLDLLTALEDQLAACPGAIPVLANTLRGELEGVVDDGR